RNGPNSTTSSASTVGMSAPLSGAVFQQGNREAEEQKRGACAQCRKHSSKNRVTDRHHWKAAADILTYTESHESPSDQQLLATTMCIGVAANHGCLPGLEPDGRGLVPYFTPFRGVCNRSSAAFFAARRMCSSARASAVKGAG